MFHLTDAQWLAVLQLVILPFFVWSVKKIVDAAVKKLHTAIVSVADEPAKLRAQEVRIEMHSQFAEIKAMMGHHEENDVERFKELRNMLPGNTLKQGA